MHTQGFTIIETIIYLGLFSIIITVMLPVLYSVQDISKKIDTEEISVMNIAFIQTKIKNMILGSEEIILPAENESSTVLRVKLRGEQGLNDVTAPDLIVVRKALSENAESLQYNFSIAGEEAGSTTVYLIW